MCMIQPEGKLTINQLASHYNKMDMFEQHMKRNKLFDSGLSLAEERKALLYSLLWRL